MAVRSEAGTSSPGLSLRSGAGRRSHHAPDYRFADGSMDDETTTYRQRGTFQLIRDHHIQKGPFFPKPIDFTVEAATGITTTRTTDKNGKIHANSEHIDLPADLANGCVGTLLLNLPHNTAPFGWGYWRHSAADE